MQRQQHELGVEADAGAERLLDAPLHLAGKRLAIRAGEMLGPSAQ